MIAAERAKKKKTKKKLYKANIDKNSATGKLQQP